MGKTTVAGLFRRYGIPVFDADRCVHELYEGPVAKRLAEIFPGSIREGRIDRTALGALVLSDRKSMARLEAVIHPLVIAERIDFLRRMRAYGTRLVVLDIPLLFETAGERGIDAIIVVTANATEQRRRVLARPGMNEDKLGSILDRQLPDREKRKRAQFIVQTRTTLESTERQIRRIISSVAAFERINIDKIKSGNSA